MKHMNWDIGAFVIYTAIAVAISLMSPGCTSPADQVNIDVTTASGSEAVMAEMEFQDMEQSGRLLSISLSNTGTEVEYIKNITVRILPGQDCNTQSRFLYAGHDMGRTPIQQRGYDDDQLSSGTFLLIRHNEASYTKTGILTWHIFRPYITYAKDEGIIITADGEHKPIKPGETISFEKIVLETGNDWQDMLFAYGEQVAEVQHIQPKKIREFKGWSTWDYYGRVYNDEDIYKNVDALKASGIEANLIQIDGGWWTDRGDYLSVKEELPDGMKGVADYIKSKGYMPGIHLDGFRADKASKIYEAHPDWFLKDQNGNTICQEIDKGDTFMKYIYFDFSNPEVTKHIKDVLTTIREEWGFQYFKIDFIRYGLKDDILKVHAKEGVTEIHAFDPSMTSMERTRAGLKAMREGIGEAFFLGCSSVFGPTFGLVDGLRTGGDISPTMDFFRTRCLQNGGNFYLNKTLVQNDADYLVLRNKHDEEAERAWGKHKFGGNISLNEARMWSDYVSLFGGIKISSDNLLTLREERKALIRATFAMKTCDRFIPIDLWDHAMDPEDAFHIMLGENEDGLYLALFNWDAESKHYAISGLPEGALNETLAGHHSKILKIEGDTDFDSLRKSLEYTVETR